MNEISVWVVLIILHSPPPFFFTVIKILAKAKKSQGKGRLEPLIIPKKKLGK